jgi:hypothetical protein
MVIVSANPLFPPFCYCPDGEPAPNDYEDTKMVGPTDAVGVITAQFKKYGGCGNQQFYATIGMVTAGPSVAIYIASPDNNGDCIVNLVDFGNFAFSYLTDDDCSDYDCSGQVNLVDFGHFASHYLHDCDSD